MFGGKFREQLLPNKTILLKFSKTKCSFETLPTTGVEPCARFNHSLNFVKPLNILCVFGGQSPELDVHSSRGCIHVLNLSLLTWQQCRVDYAQSSFCFEQRHSHCATASGAGLIVFGGIGTDGFVSTTFIEQLSFEESLDSELHNDSEQSIGYFSKPVSPKSPKKIHPAAQPRIVSPTKELIFREAFRPKNR